MARQNIKDFGLLGGANYEKVNNRKRATFSKIHYVDSSGATSGMMRTI